MSSKKTKISRKDPLKSPKVWEKARREKMKIYFNELQEVLPFYDPSTPMSRFEILQKSKICIKDLQDQNQDLLNGGFDEVYRNKMSKLKQRVKELLKRVDQLTDLLRAANIMIPPLEMYPEDLKSCSSFKWMNQRPKKWTEKINLVVPDEKIKSVLTLIKDYKKNSGKINLKKKQISKNVDKSKNVTSQPCLQRTGDKSKKMLKMSKKVINLKGVKSDKKFESSDSFNGSQSPSQFKENQPVDYNLLSVNNTALNKGSGNNNDINDNSSNSDNKDISDTNSSNNNIFNHNNNDSCSSTGSNTTSSSRRSNNNINANNNSDETSNNSKSKHGDQNISLPSSKNQCNLDTGSAQIVTLQSSTNKVGVPQQLIEAQQNIVIPPAPSVLQSNTFILTNDGSLVQLPILNSLGTVFDGNSNLITPATIVKPNAGLLTPIVINKPSPVIVLQKPTPQIIQTAQILNAAPQVISVSKSNVQILNSPIIYTSSNAVTGSRTLSHILSKAPANKKRIMRDSTTTTYVNKIPIAALSKHSYTKKSVNNNASGEKNKPADVKGKEVLEKQAEPEAKSNVEIQNEEQTVGKSNESKIEKSGPKAEERKKSNYSEDEFVLEGARKRNLEDEKLENSKKQKMKENLEDNFFKPIENPIEADGMFCNLALPNAINPSLSVSPTAAFLSSFPIVAPIRSEADDDTGDKKTDEGKETKQNEGHSPHLEHDIEGGNINEGGKALGPKEFLTETTQNNLQAETNVVKEKGNDLGDEQIKLITKNSVNNSNNFNNGINSSRDTLSNSSNSVSSSNNTAVPVGVNNSNNKPNLAQQQQQQQQQIDSCKTWGQYHHENCEIRPETFYLPPDSNIHIGHSVAPVDTASTADMNFPGISTNMSNLPYKTYLPNSSAKTNNLGIQDTLNEQVGLKTNQFEYPQKENYMNQVPTYNTERPVIKKPCSNNTSDSYSVPKTQSTTYPIDSGPLYQLIPAKEVPNQRNSRTVNWMTEPDNRNRGMLYCSQNDKMPVPKTPIYTQIDNFYPNNQNSKIPADCSLNFVGNDQAKVNYQKNDFFGKDQRCKPLEKRTHTKCYPKAPQNTYNIFDYNYAGSCYTEDESNKYWNNGQPYSGKIKKNVHNVGKKKPEGIIHAPNEHQTVDTTKRPPEQIITNLDFNPVPNQECFTWMPGKNVEWLPSKSFGLDTNLVVPSTLPTLVGDLALGTTSTNDITLVKTSNSKICQPNLKTLPNDITKDYIDLGMGNATMAKPMETMDANKQYLEPFANLSKNIFDMTPSNVHNPQMPKNDFDKVNFLGSNNNETIILKNIFELPVSKSNGIAGDFNRQKQRNVNNTQNTFLSVSQLVEPPTFEGNNMKSENQLEANGAKPDLYGQNYPNFNNPKTFKGKNRSSHCKYNDRKYQGYKNGSSSYTAEALIRSNNVNCQTNEFAVDINTNFFNGKTSQKPEQFSANNKTDFEVNGKSDYQGPNQNIYTDFNFSSPVPNFTIGSTVSSTDFGNHEANSNFSSQNNSFFGDFITPEYPLSENLPNSLLIPPCSIALQSPFVIDKRNFPVEKSKNNSKQYSTSRNRIQECSKTSFNDFSIPPSSAIFTTASLTCPTIFTTSACQNLLPVPTQSIPISFSSPSFTNSNISFPPLTTSTNNYHKFPANTPQNSVSGSFLPSNAMFTTCTSKPNSSTQNCYSTNPLTSVTNSVISSPFSVANVPFSTSSQSTIPFFSLSNPIIPSSAPTSSSNSLANFNLSTIFPEINQKGNYHYS